MSFDRDGEIIDVTPTKPKRRRWKWLLVIAIVLLFVVASRALSIYISALWFGSLGYSSVFWFIFRAKLQLFLIFLIATTAILRVGFWLVEREFASFSFGRRTVFINQQPLNFSPARLLRPLAWVVSIIAGLIFGFEMREDWRSFALYFHQAPTGITDPIFNKPLGFYLFTLPIYDSISSWLLSLSFIILIATVIYAALAVTQQGISTTGDLTKARKTSLTAVSIALAPLLIVLAWRFSLSRYPYLWGDHQTFSGVTFVEANHLLPAFMWVAVALILAALILLINAFTMRKIRILIGALAIPLLVYIVGAAIIPAYVTNFIVKPNELGRETPYIVHNIIWTRRAFGIDRIEQRNFEALTTLDSFDLQNNRATVDNIRLWDWRALKDTLTQIQAIRTYYDFTDVDVDRYVVGGELRQMMLGTREINSEKLPPSSRNWVNEKLIYTHGYGVTMNTANGFDSEGMPKFVLSNMPVESTAPEIKVTRPEIYFGQETNHDVYVKTKRMEFNYPQGETNNLTTYDGTGGIPIGGYFRRWLLAWGLDDLTKLPFSDDVTSESRALIHRNIREIVDGVAPFLTYDNDPYMVINSEGRMFWIIDAFTETANYPYSRHYQAGDKNVNYIRNSVKVVIDAYNGTTNFYIFDSQDPLIQTYRAVFPTLFRDAKDMPQDLRAHVRYPETLIKTQAEVFGLYHTQDTNSFFQREDLWNVARQVSLGEDKQQQEQSIEPYFVLMQLPGENKGIEFVEILPFTPSNRNNMIGWIAGRCDGDAYGSLIAYNFPKSRLVDGPLQIEARIDQNAQLSGQFTLWNQQGSHVQRGHLLVIPIGRSLLYVEPIYLKAERSPMPELRLVVLATQDRLEYGSNFDEALNKLFGEAVKQIPAQPAQPGQPKPNASPQASPTPPPTGAQNIQQLINRAIQEFDEYQRLTSEGKLGEAGKKLEEHKRTLEELKKVGSSKP
ncbi:MAG: membrane protein [Acidobacteria bacterium]|nr:MAG: membrane protein [Acidobacteriota bacterium]